VATGSADATIRVWCTSTGECVRILDLHNGTIWWLAFSHDSTLIASGVGDNTIQIWNTSTGECFKTLRGHLKSVTAVTFPHDSTLIASGSDDGTIRIWRSSMGECIRTLDIEVPAIYLRFQSGNSHVLTGRGAFNIRKVSGRSSNEPLPITASGHRSFLGLSGDGCWGHMG
jgi:WD40 repeat protein